MRDTDGGVVSWCVEGYAERPVHIHVASRSIAGITREPPVLHAAYRMCVSEEWPRDAKV